MQSSTRLTLCCLGLAVLSGCAIKGNTSLVEPTDGARARVRGMVYSVFNNYRGMRAYPNSTCVDPEAKGNGTLVNSQFGFEKSLNGQSRGMPATESSQDKEINKAEVYVAANQPIAFSYLIPGGDSAGYFGCATAISFTPEAGADYEVLFQKNECKGTISKLLVPAQGASKAVLVPVTYKSAERCPVR